MPVNPTYPGVHIEELPSRGRTITGVPISIVAFVGAASRGRTDQPVHVTSLADYERGLGRLDASSPMSYAVSQFHQNQGGEVQIVRIVSHDVAARTDLGNGVLLEAAQAGRKGNGLRARIGSGDPTLYTLTIHPAEGSDEFVTGIQKQAAPDAADSMESKLANATLVKLKKKDAADPPASPAPAAGAAATVRTSTGSS